MSAALRFSGVVKRYSRDPVLAGIDLTIEIGQFVGLVGVNGAGKTTLLKSLLDFCEINAGRMEIFGIDHRRTRARARLAFMPESFVPPNFLTGAEFLRYMSRLYGQDYIPASVTEVLDNIDLAPAALGKPVRTLSKGMAQKLGLAACLLSGRELFVLDEPMSGLDPKGRAMFKRCLLELKGQGRTLFFSTHLLADVEEICDRIAVLHGGVLRYIGAPEEFVATYQADSLEDAYLRCVNGS